MSDDSVDKNSAASGASPAAGLRQQLRSGASSLGDVLVGKELAGRYVVMQLLGTGAMGVVYKARHKVLDREVAIKVLKREASGDEVSRRRFETEAKAAGSLMHPNLIAVHDSGFMDDGTPFLVMDYLEGESLGSLLKREKRLDPLRLINILKQVCTGLSHAHNKGLVHRDLKPNNIMLQEYAGGRDLVKVVDFGIVKPVDSDQDLTETGQIFGTPFYMSPEQCQGKKLDARSDVYALGCLVYRIMCGKPPFTGDNAVATIVMHVKDPPPPFPSDALQSEVSRALVPVVLKMLEKDPAQRYQTMDELRVALESIEHEHKTDALPRQSSGDSGQSGAVAAASQAASSVSAAAPVSSPASASAAGTLEAAAQLPGDVAATQSLKPQQSTLLKPQIIIATTIGSMVVGMVISGVIGTTLFEPANVGSREHRQHRQPLAPPDGTEKASGNSVHSDSDSNGATQDPATQSLLPKTAAPAPKSPAKPKAVHRARPLPAGRPVSGSRQPVPPPYAPAYAPSHPAPGYVPAAPPAQAKKESRFKRFLKKIFR